MTSLALNNWAQDVKRLNNSGFETSVLGIVCNSRNAVTQINKVLFIYTAKELSGI